MSTQNRFFVGFNTLTKDIIPDTMFKHSSDTIDAMKNLYGDSWDTTKTYLSIAECEVVFNDESKN
jgi:hypothetical protein